MANFGSILKNLRVSREITQEQLASMLGVSRSAVGMYETGGRQPDFEMMETIADIFNVDMDYLMGRSPVERKHPLTPPANKPIPKGFVPMPEMAQVPLIGSIACGTPITAEQNIKSYIGVPATWRADFALECHGDSMAPTTVTAMWCAPQPAGGGARPDRGRAHRGGSHIETLLLPERCGAADRGQPCRLSADGLHRPGSGRY